MNRLATETNVAASTINRPLREKDWKGKLSRETIRKIQVASGIDPTPFIPAGFAEEQNTFASPAANTYAGRVLANLNQPGQDSSQAINDIRIEIDGRTAHIAATVDLVGLKRLLEKLEVLGKMLDS